MVLQVITVSLYANYMFIKTKWDMGQDETQSLTSCELMGWNQHLEKNCLSEFVFPTFTVAKMDIVVKEHVQVPY